MNSSRSDTEKRTLGPSLAHDPRSMLFVPGGDSTKLSKIPSLVADVIVVDLEDAVADEHKESARAITRGALADFDGAVLSRVAIRINAYGSIQWDDDLLLCAEVGVRGVVVPKLASSEPIGIVRQALSKMGSSDTLVFGGIESLVGVRDCHSFVSHDLAGVYFGAEDFIEAIGGHRTPGGLEVLYARSQVVLAAKIAGIAAIDQAVTAVHDLDRFADDASVGSALGYTGKICLNPAQAVASNEAFSPTPAEVERAASIIESAGAGVQLVDDAMVDGVHVRAATRLLSRYKQLSQR